MFKFFNPESQRPLPNTARTEVLNTDVDKLVAQKAELEKSLKDFDQAQASEILERAPEVLLSQRFDTMVKRLAAETNIIAEIEDTVQKENLLRNPDAKTFAVPVEFGLEEKEKLKSKYGEAGHFDPVENKIQISENDPTKKQLWVLLTQSGMPEVVRVLDHELIHYWEHKSLPPLEKVNRTIKENKATRAISKQWSRASFRFQRFIDNLPSKIYDSASALAFKASNKLENLSYQILRETDDNTELGKKARFKVNVLTWFANISWSLDSAFSRLSQKHESHLHSKEVKQEEKFKKKLQGRDEYLVGEVVAQKTGRVFDESENRNTALIESLVGVYHYKQVEDIDKIAVTSLVVDRLLALGLSHKDITIRLMKAKYDSKTSSYLDLEHEIEQTALNQGLTVNDLDSISDILRIKTHIENLRAAQIAQEELLKLAA